MAVVGWNDVLGGAGQNQGRRSQGVTAMIVIALIKCVASELRDNDVPREAARSLELHQYEHNEQLTARQCQ